MAKKPNVLPHPQNALNKFMVRIIIERDRLNDAFALDGNTAYPSTTMTPKHLISAEPCQDNAGGLVESHLEDMYHSLYDETPELPKLIEATKTECCMVDANFAGILIPPLNAMVKVHRSCIEDLRMGKGWNWEVHCEAFEELNQLSGVYASKLIKMNINPAGQTTLESTPEISPTVIKPTTRKNSKSKKVQGQGKTIDSDLLFCAALVKHHGYESGSCKNSDPISCTGLASLTKKHTKSCASTFLKKRFKGHCNYVNLCSNSVLLNTAMKMLNGETATPYLLLGAVADKIQGRFEPESDR